MQEFQIATNRFAAESGPLGLVGHQRRHPLGHRPAARLGVAVLRARQRVAGRCRRPTTDRSGDAPPFDRQQIAGAVGGPLRPGRLFWFGAAEYRNQDGAVLVGARDMAARTIRRTFAPAPLDDVLGSGARRLASERRRRARCVRYAGEQADDTGASSARPRDRLGDAAPAEPQQLPLGARHLDARAVSPTLRQRRQRLLQHLRQRDRAGRAGPQLTFPSMQDGVVVPRAAGHDADALPDRRHAHAGARRAQRCAPAARCSAWTRGFDLGVFREGRVELVEDFPAFDHNGDGRVDDNDLLFAVTLRSGKPDQDLVHPRRRQHHVAVFVQDDWRVRPDLTLNLGLRYELDTDVKNISRVRRDQPDRAAVPAGRRASAT